MLELGIQVSESTSQMLMMVQKINENPQEVQNELLGSVKMLENKMTTFLAKVYDMNELGFNSQRSSHLSLLDEAIIIAAKHSKKRKEYDIEQLPLYLEEMKQESKHDQQQFKTISEVEEYVYQVLHKHRNFQNRKDASLEDLMAVTASDHSQDLTNRIRQLIYLDQQAMKRRGEDSHSIGSSDHMPSIIQETKNFDRMFFKNDDDSSESNFDLKKVKKIEFSQSIHQDKSEKSLPFTHNKIDNIVFQGTLKDKEFDINEAKKLLKKVVKGRKTSVQSEQSFEDPGAYTDRQYQELSSLPSTIDDHFANIQVDLKSKKNLPKQPYQDHKENLKDTVKHISQIKESQSQKTSPQKVQMQIPTKVSKLKLPDRSEEQHDGGSLLRRDQSQNRLLVHNPSQISLAGKLKPKVAEQSQEHLKNLQQQFYQIIQQQKQNSEQKSNPYKQQQPKVQNYSDIDKLLKNLNRNSSFIQEGQLSQDEEAIQIKNKRSSIKRAEQSDTQEKNKKPKKKQSLNRKGSLPKIGQSFVQEMAQPQIQSRHSKKTSQSVLYTNVNQSHYQSQASQQFQKEKSSEMMKRSKSSAGFHAGGMKRGNSAIKVTGQNTQQKLQKSQSSKKYQNLSDVKNGSNAQGAAMNRHTSFKRLIVMD